MRKILNRFQQLILYVCVLSSMLISCTNEPRAAGGVKSNISNTTPQENQKTTPVVVTKPSPPKLWYTGGTLHRLKTGDWRTASYDNKLATSADWAAAIKSAKGQSYNGDLVTMKKDALDIMACVDEVAIEPTINMQLTEVVKACAVLMKMI